MMRRHFRPTHSACLCFGLALVALHFMQNEVHVQHEKSETNKMTSVIEQTKMPNTNEALDAEKHRNGTITKVDENATETVPSNVQKLLAPGDFETRCPGIDEPILVHLFPEDDHDHFFRLGLVHSPCFHLSGDPLAATWIANGDTASCELVEAAWMNRLDESCVINTTSSPKGCNLENQWNIAMADCGDKPCCEGCKVSKLFERLSPHSPHKIHVKQCKRSMVVGRTGFKPGTIENCSQPVHHVLFGVRDDVAQVVNEHMSNCCLNLSLEDPSFVDPLNPVFVKRPGGARHFWCDADGPRRNNKGQFWQSVAVFMVNNMTSSTPHGDITAGLAGHKNTKGRTEAQVECVHEMLKHKIAVVAQPDKWEGHFRLMEAFAGGGLVLADPMLTPPKHLVDGVHCVVCQSLEDLREKIPHCLQHKEERLQIAWNGWKAAMTHCRSWHLMEAMILGSGDAWLHFGITSVTRRKNVTAPTLLLPGGLLPQCSQISHAHRV